MTETTSQTLSNYRYYCDGDPMDTNGSSRWTLRRDPVFRPPDYVPQASRTRANLVDLPPTDSPMPLPAEPYQEWEDRSNGFIMGRTSGCNDLPRRSAYSYTVQSWDPSRTTYNPEDVPNVGTRPGHPGLPAILNLPPTRATMTVCNSTRFLQSTV